MGSGNHINYYLKRLEERGLIRRVHGQSRGMKLPQLTSIPVKGRIAAGLPIEHSADPEQMLDVGQELAQLSTYALEVAGNSMVEDHVYDGDYVVIRPQSACQHGDIVVAVHLLEENTSSATLKRFFQEHDQVRLQPANATMEPIYVSKQE